MNTNAPHLWGNYTINKGKKQPEIEFSGCFFKISPKDSENERFQAKKNENIPAQPHILQTVPNGSSNPPYRTAAAASGYIHMGKVRRHTKGEASHSPPPGISPTSR